MIYGGFDECLKEIKALYTSQQETIEHLRRKLCTYNKEEEIAKRDETINKLYDHALYMMFDKEKERERAFRERHWRETGCKNGNHYIYDLVGTGIGVGITIICPVCGAKEDITDIDSW